MDKRKTLIASIAFIAVMIITGIVYAATSINSAKNYAINVVNDGSNMEATDSNIKVQTIVTSDDDTEITMQTSVENLNQINPKEVAIVIDTSYSMSTNSDIAEVKEAAINILNNIASEDATTKVSLIVDGAIKNKKLIATAGNVKILTNNINAITFASSIDMNTSLNLANSTDVFTATGTDKYVIAITDATDSMDVLDTTTGVTTNTLETLATNDIKIYSILTGITSTSFGTPDNPKPMGVLKNDGTPGPDGTVYMLDSFVGSNQTGSQDIVNNINKTVNNVSVANTFDLSILGRYGNFTLEIVNNETDGSAVLNSDNTLTWNIDKIIGSKKAVVTYKLKLNRSATIGTNSLYNDIKVIDKTEVQYIPYNNTNIQVISESGSSAPSPTIQIADAYELRIQAVGKDTTVPVEGVKFDIKGTNDKGEVILNKTVSGTQNDLITSKDGYVTIDTLIKPIGIVNYIITPHVDGLVGYSTTDPIHVSINNQFNSSGSGLTGTYAEYNDKISINDISGQKSVEIEVPIELQKFKFIVDVEDLANNSLKLNGGNFRLLQPKYNNKYEINALYASSVDGQVIFETTAMTTAGEYEYELTQPTDINGYENMVYAKIKVTFDSNGNVIPQSGVQITHNSNIQEVYLDESTVEVKLGLKSIATNVFDFELNVKEDTSDALPIKGVWYDVAVSNTTNINDAYYNYTGETDDNGQIIIQNLSVNNTWLHIFVTEKADSSSKYVNDLTTKEFEIKIVNGIIEEYRAINPTTLDVQKDSNIGKKVNLNLTKTPKSEVNQIKVHVRDYNDNLAIPNIDIELIDETNSNAIYSIGTVTSDATNGDAIFTLPTPMNPGVYLYSINAVNLPSSYETPTLKQYIEVNVGSDGKIDTTQYITISSSSSGSNGPILSAESKLDYDNTTLYYSVNVEFGLVAKNKAYFTINLLQNNTTNPIANATYDIDIQRDGSPIYSTIHAITNTTGYLDGYSNGGIVIPNLDTRLVTVTVKQTNDSSIGYKADQNIYVIGLYKNTSGEIVASINLYGGLPAPAEMTVTSAKTNKKDIITFNHKNEKITPLDTRMQLTIQKTDWVSKLPMNNTQLHIVSNDFKIIDPTTGAIVPLDIKDSRALTGSSNGLAGKVILNDLIPNLTDSTEEQTCSIIVYEWDILNNTDKIDTMCKIDFTFKFENNKMAYTLRGVNAATEGQELFIPDQRYYTGESTATYYKNIASVDIYGNYGEKANVTLDLKKLGYNEDPDQRPELDGAKYDVVIEDPTGSPQFSSSIEIDNNNSEINVNLKLGSKIYLTEKEDNVPAGYETNDKTEIIEVTKLDLDKLELAMVLASSNYDVPRIELETPTINATGDGWIQKIKLIDYEANRFNFGITSMDSDTSTGNIPLSGNSYKIVTQIGNSAITPTTDSNGKTETKIGGFKENDYIEYTISQKYADGTLVANNYKRLNGNIVVKVYFDTTGKPDVNDTRANQTDPNYGITWDFDKIDKDGISIKILHDRREALKVNVTVKDKITNNVINGINYEVSPTNHYDGKGTSGTTIANVGYVLENQTGTYKIHLDTLINYVSIPDQEFTVDYNQNCEVTGAAKAVGSDSYYFDRIDPNATDVHQVDLVMYIDPAVPFVITNVAYDFNNSTGIGNALQGGAFQITRDSDNLQGTTRTTLTDSNGKQVFYDGALGQDGDTITYTVKQTKTASNKYAKIEDFNITVTYGTDRKITNVYLTSPNKEINRLVEVSKIQPSSSTDIGYNGNNRGIVTITVKNYPAFRMNITNVDRKDLTPLGGATYSVSSDIPTYGTSITGTDSSTGTETIYIDKTIFDDSVSGGIVNYTIKETTPSNGYQKIGANISVKVKFNENGYVNINDSLPVEITSDYVKVAQYWVDPISTPEDYFTINITIMSTPKVRMNIINKNGNTTSPVQLGGAVFTITPDGESSTSVTTNATTATTAILEGITPINSSKGYTIVNDSAATGYQKIGTNLKLDIIFDSNGYVDVNGVNINPQYQYYIGGQPVSVKVTSIDYFSIDVEITSFPKITVNVTNVDRTNGTTLLSGATYTITPSVGTPDTQTTTAGQSTFGINTNATIANASPLTFKIVNDQAAYGYQKIEDTELQVTFDNNGYVTNATSSENFVKVTSIGYPGVNYEDNYVINLTIESNPLIKINLNKVAQSNLQPLSSVQFSVKATVKSTGEEIYKDERETNITDADGNLTFNIERNIDNQTIEYTIKEVKNLTGFEYIQSKNHEFKLTVTYDSDGKIIPSSVILTTYNDDGSVKQNSTSVDGIELKNIKDFDIDLQIKNKEIEQFSISLKTYDAYDYNKKVDATLKAYLTLNTHSGDEHYPDNPAYDYEDTNYTATLQTGADRDGDGVPDYGHGEDYQVLGAYTDDTKTRYLKLEELVKPDKYYEGTNVENSTYKSTGYLMYIKLQFTDEGKIKNVSIRPHQSASGYRNHIKFANGQYLYVQKDQNNPYKLNIELKYYPKFEVTVNDRNNYTGGLLEGKINLSTNWYTSYENYANRINAGYIRCSCTSDDYGPIGNYNYQTSTAGNSAKGIWTGEANKVRTVYIREPYQLIDSQNTNNKLPVNFQKHISKYIDKDLDNKLSPKTIGYIKVRYNSKGEICTIYSQNDYNSLTPAEKNNASYYVVTTSSSKLLQNSDLNITTTSNKHGVVIDVNYRPTTSFKVTAKDKSTQKTMENVLYDYTSSSRYTAYNSYYSDHSTLSRINLFAYTNTSGNATWSYWGENKVNGTRDFTIKSVLNYDFMINSTKYSKNLNCAVKSNYNGDIVKHNHRYQDYKDIEDIKYRVSYDSEGKINGVIAYDADNNIIVDTQKGVTCNYLEITYDDYKVCATYLYERKVNIKINKEDADDKTKLNTTFTVTKNSDVSTNTTFKTGKAKEIDTMSGNDEWVTYTIKETPISGYAKLDPFDINVHYTEGGMIDQIKYKGQIVYQLNASTSITGAVTYTPIYHNISTAPFEITSVNSNVEDLRENNRLDIEMTVKNKAQFMVDIQLLDQFYTSEAIPGVEFEVTNDMGDIMQDPVTFANPVTDGNGRISLPVGTVYANKTVTYTIKQKTQASGYYRKNSDIILKVTYDAEGKIDINNTTTPAIQYVQGNDNQKYLYVYDNQRGLYINIYNKPKDVLIGLDKMDNVTGDHMSGVTFSIKRQEVGSATSKTETYTTNDNGIIREKVDEFDSNKTVRYTISEISQPASYRKIQDIEFEVVYKEDGNIYYSNIVKNNNGKDSSGRERVSVECIPGVKSVLSNGEKANIKVSVYNDNSYDLIIKNQDKDYNTAIRDTKYDVSINNIAKTLNNTNSNGIININDNKESGEININISEATIGEGYRANSLNSIKFNINKGTSVYSLGLDINSIIANGYNLISGPTNIYDTDYLDGVQYEIELDNSTSTIAVIEVYEDTGVIRVTFKNESKLLMNLTKTDSQDYTKLLEGAQFEIKEEEIDDSGNVIGTAKAITTTGVNDTTNNLGKLNFDLGKRYQNKIIKYTFKEITAPADYQLIEEFEVIYKFDQYGLIDTTYTNVNKPRRANAEANKFYENLIVNNGDIPETYSIKIVSQDTTNNRGINNSTFDITVRDNKGNIITDASGNKLQLIGVTTSQQINNWGTIEDGVIYINNINYEGAMYIDVNQTGYAEGYVKGNNTKQGIVEATNTYVVKNVGDDRQSDLKIVNNAGFNTNESIINPSDNDDEIKIYVKNDSQLQLKIHKISSSKDKDGNEIPIQGATFTIDEITKQGTTGTGIQYYSDPTDDQGNVTVNIELPKKYGTQVIYQITEDPLNKYYPLDPIQVIVDYDGEGKILYYMSTNQNYLTVEETDADTGLNTLGSRTLPLTIKNDSNAINTQYKVVIQPGYDFLQTSQFNILGGLEYDLVIEEEYGTTIDFEDRTSVEGVGIEYDRSDMRGYGQIKFYVTLKNADGYIVNSNTRLVTLYKNADGLFVGDEHDVAGIDYRIDNDTHTIYLIDKVKIDDSKMNIVLYKMDKETNSQIINNPATLTLTQVKDNTEDTDEDQSDDNTSTYEVTYDANGGIYASESQTESIDNDMEIGGTAIWSLHKFLGWAEDPTATSPDYQVGDSYTGRTDITLYAVWEEDLTDTKTYYTISYDANGGSDEPANQLKPNGTDITLSIKQPVREGYMFLGWSKNKNDTEAQYCKTNSSDGDDNATNSDGTNSNTTSNDTIYTEDSDITLYAIWEKVTTSLGTEFVLYSGSTSMEYGNSIIQLDMPEKEGVYTYRIYENSAPDGYKGLENFATMKITFENIDGKMTMTNIEIDNENVKELPISTSKSKAIAIYNTIEVPTDEYRLNITKVDADQTYIEGDGTVKNVPINDALFKVKLPDENDTSVYTKSGENAPSDGQLDYCYVEQDKDYEVRLTHMARPTVDEVKAAPDGILTHTYEFTEAAAPDGYAKITQTLILTIDFEVVTDDAGNETVKIKDATSSEPSILRINRMNDERTLLDIDILNDEQESAYTVHYDANTTDTVTVPADQLKTAGMPLTLDANVPVRSGFTFKEWNTSADGTGTAFSPAGTYALDADVTLYAIWEVAQYNIQYKSNAPIDPNTGVEIGLVTDMPADQTKTHGIDITLDDDNLTPTIPNVAKYYEFAGWNTLSDGTGTHYDAGDVYNIDADLTLYAEWNYIIYYNANVPTDSNHFPMSTPNYIPKDQHEKVNSQTDAIIDDLSVYTNAPTMDGYKFKEWNTAKDGTGDKYNPNDTYTNRKGIELYAIWQYEITYDENKPLDENNFPINATISNMPIENPQVVDVNNTAIVDNTTDNPNVPTMSPDDYVFIEWNTKPDGSGDSYNPDDVYSGNISVKLYAIWEEQTLYLKSLTEDYRITDVTFTTAKRYTLNTIKEDEYNDGDKYVLGITPEINVATTLKNSETEGTTIDKFLTKIDTNATTIKFYKKDGITEITDRNSLISTGSILKASKGTKSIELILIARGDVWGKSINVRYKDEDGILRSSDQSIISKYLTDNTILPDIIDRLAADTNLDGKINTRDAGDIVQGILQCNKNELDR